MRQARSTQRYQLRCRGDEERLTASVVELASLYGRWGYRRIGKLLRAEGWRVNDKRVARIWRQEGLKIPQKQPKLGRLWLNDGSCVRRRPERPNHVWAYDFCADRTHDGRPLRLLAIVDEFTRECLSIDVGRKLKSDDVLARLTELFVQRGLPEHIRSDNGPEFTSKRVRNWLSNLGVNPLFIEPGSPWENGYVESFNGRMRDELLNLERFDTLQEAKVLVERWRHIYNRIRPHSSLGYRPPAPETKEPWPPGFAPLRPSSMVPGLS
jgi:transposase InsO family protein